VFFLAVYFVATELNSSTASAAEVLVFQHGHVPKEIQNGKEQFGPDTESASTPRGQANSSTTNVEAIEPQRDVFTWRNLQYDIEIKGEPRRLLDDVAGWVKPGTLTALMGVSGAGKTTLLDVLAQRTSMGIITGDMFVSGRPQEPSFQRSTGYVQQQG
jgi:ATP-binding cassette subfamily G (WHITE) protein 2 (PDR)